MLIIHAKKNSKPNITITSFWHRHLPMKLTVGENAEYVNLEIDLLFYLRIFDGDTWNKSIRKPNTNFYVFVNSNTYL
jgi:UDP-2,3-diacylglucosamine hydrolase